MRASELPGAWALRHHRCSILPVAGSSLTRPRSSLARPRSFLAHPRSLLTRARSSLTRAQSLLTYARSTLAHRFSRFAHARFALTHARSDEKHPVACHPHARSQKNHRPNGKKRRPIIAHTRPIIGDTSPISARTPFFGSGNGLFASQPPRVERCSSPAAGFGVFFGGEWRLSLPRSGSVVVRGASDALKPLFLTDTAAWSSTFERSMEGVTCEFPANGEGFP